MQNIKSDISYFTNDEMYDDKSLPFVRPQTVICFSYTVKITKNITDASPILKTRILLFESSVL